MKENKLNMASMRNQNGSSMQLHFKNYLTWTMGNMNHKLALKFSNWKSNTIHIIQLTGRNKLCHWKGRMMGMSDSTTAERIPCNHWKLAKRNKVKWRANLIFNIQEKGKSRKTCVNCMIGRHSVLQTNYQIGADHHNLFLQ